MQEITYTRQGDYLLPNLLPPQESDARPIGKYGRQRLRYLKEHRSGYYTGLLISGKLHHHLHQVEENAQNQMELLIRKMAESQGVTEQLKSASQMEWVRRMNNIRDAAEEMIQAEIIYA